MNIRVAFALFLIGSFFTLVLGCGFYEFSFETNGGTMVDDYVDVDAQSWDGTVETPTRPGYVFAGWFFDPEFTLPYSEEAVRNREDGGSGVFHLYAKWISADVDVTVEYYLEDEGGSFVLDEAIVMGGTLGETVHAPIRFYEHYHLYRDHPEFRTYGTPAEGEPLVLKLYYERDTYRFVFNPMNGTGYTAFEQKWGTPLPEVADPIREGYAFDGWYGAEMDSEPYAGTVVPQRDSGVYARWILLPFDVVYVENGGAAVSDGLFEEGDPVDLPDPPTRVGHTFAGWYADPDFGGEPFADGAAMPAGDLTLYARWTPNLYPVTFVVNGGPEMPDLMVAYGEPVNRPDDPVREHWVFGGWFDEILDEPVVWGLPMGTEGVVVYALWVPKMVTITFVPNGADPIDPLTVQSGQPYALPSPEYAGHVFDGWYEDEEKTVRHVNDGSMPTEDLTLYANWFGMTYFIHFDTMGGPYVQDLSLPSGSPLSLPVPAREGFVFDGWWDAMYAVRFTASTMPEENLVLYAKWIPA